MRRGIPTRAWVKACICDFKRRESQKLPYVEVQVAFRVKVLQWLRSPMSSRQGVKFELRFDPSITTLDEDTLGDVFIVASLSQLHESVVTNLKEQIGRWIFPFAQALIIRQGGGDIILNGRIRCPDGFVAPFQQLPAYNRPRFLFEVDITTRGGNASINNCLAWFDDIPLLRAVILIKVYPRRRGRYPVIGVSFRRNANDEVDIVDAVELAHTINTIGTPSTS
ncbi:Aste57867_17987 [Aphanomyces stellatus]|uniref:Aste57867_17987 protein n=1 Tax=Aphanomyces stellatus TaxID=120398 RepID=A0A485L9J7_9STRA|nr:hypothetical protein As57867_017925 [Aphanomyces stellatus]VFT94726.1 Aste57867_17987 [Aphanomyces stellatus]